MSADDIWDRFFGKGFGSFDERIDALFSEMNSIDDPRVKTYGYTMFQGSDGVQHFREFGNAKNSLPATAGCLEPFADVTNENGLVRAVFELPGTDKKDIEIDAAEQSLHICAKTAKKDFDKTVALPCAVDIGSAHATYNNGILEVTFKAIGSEERKKRITIE